MSILSRIVISVIIVRDLQLEIIRWLSCCITGLLQQCALIDPNFLRSDYKVPNQAESRKSTDVFGRRLF